MEIIPLMVVLICAPWWAASLELRIPGLGKMNLEFIRETTTVGTLEGRTDGNGTVGDQTTLAGEVTPIPGNEEVTSNETAAAEAEQTTKVGNEAGTKGTTKESKETATTVKSNGETTQSGNAEQNPGNEGVTNDKTDAAEVDQTTKVGNEAVTEGTTKVSKESPTTAKGNSETTQTGNAKQSEATKAVTNAESKKVEATTKAQAPPKNSANREDKKETTLSTMNSEATTEVTTVKDNSNNKKEDATTEQDAAGTTAKSEADEDDDDDDFDMSDVWDDVEDPPEEFGREYDLDPKLLDSGNSNAFGGDDDFQPKLELPPDMTRDMFYDVHPSNNGTEGVEPGEEGIFDRLKKFFSIGNLIEQLDTIPGKVQTLMDQFQQKKSDGLRKLREKIDSSTETIGNKISEAFAKLKKPKLETPQECLGRVQENFKQYEAALQEGIGPCLEKAQSVLGKQEGVLKGAMERFRQMLTDMQSCAQKLEGASIQAFVTSLLNMGRCTKRNIQSKIEQALQPQMQRLQELVQRQGAAMQGNMNATGECIKRKLQLSKFQKQRLDLIAEGKQCLERRQ